MQNSFIDETLVRSFNILRAYGEILPDEPKPKKQKKHNNKRK